MAAISVLSAELTSLWRASSVFLSKCGETMIALKAWPQPPMMGPVLASIDVKNGGREEAGE